MELILSGSALTTSLAIDKLSSLFVLTGEDPKLLKGMELADLQNLRAGLALLDSILKDADAKSRKAVPVTSWMEQINEVAEHIDDIISDFMRKVSQRLQRRPLILRAPSEISTRWSLSSHVQNVERLLVKIQEAGWRYYPFEYGDFQRYQPRSDFPLIKEFIVGVDTAENDLIQRLTEGETRRLVISLVGSGGIGKTTLAKMVYHNEVVSRCFDCRAWITVSRTYSMKEILKVMLIKEMAPKRSDMARLN